MSVILSIEEVNEFLDDAAMLFPMEFFEELNGGICLQEDAVADPDTKTYIMGEYLSDPALGNYINIYYGSFAALAGEEEWSLEEWEDELYTTLAHELTHHVEGRAGEHGLEIKDAEELARWQEEGE